jgi:hypothetical protein
MADDTTKAVAEEAAKAAGEGAAKAGDAAKNILGSFQANPKILYVVVGAAAVIGLVLALSGGGSEGQVVKASVAIGQAVTLKNPNGGDTQLNALPQLTSVAMTEEDDKQIVCHVTPGTSGVVEAEQGVGLLKFLKVKVTEGPCQGNGGWVADINVQPK